MGSGDGRASGTSVSSGDWCGWDDIGVAVIGRCEAAAHWDLRAGGYWLNYGLCAHGAVQAPF